MDGPGGCWTSNSREKWYLCISDLARITCLDITRSFHIFSRLPRDHFLFAQLTD